MFLIERDLDRRGRTYADFGMPSLVLNWEAYKVNHLISDELAYDPRSEAELHLAKVERLNADQRACYKKILKSIEIKKETSHFFLSGPAGTGKTFLYHTLCHFFRSQRKIVLCVASSGIAALFLPGGRTSHSRFKIPLNCVSNSTCNITRQFHLAELLRQTSLII